MGALAEQWFNDDAGHEPVAVRGLSVHGTDEESIGNTAGPGWNVLAEEIVAYPPRSKRIWLERKYEDLGGQPERDGLRGRAYADAWLDRGARQPARPAPRRLGKPHEPDGGAPREPGSCVVDALCQPPRRRSRDARSRSADPRRPDVNCPELSCTACPRRPGNRRPTPDRCGAHRAARVAAPPPRRRHPRSARRDMVRHRSRRDLGSPGLDRSHSRFCPGSRGLPVRGPARRHALVDCEPGRAGSRSEAARRRARGSARGQIPPTG